MTFAQPNRSRSNKRRRSTLSAPAQVETMESRLLLTAPTVLAPIGVAETGSPQIMWSEAQHPTTGEAAVSYDLWVSSRENFTTLFVKSGADAVAGTTYTPTGAEELTLGDIRVWARGNFSDGTQSAWSRGHDFRVEVTPAVTGPVGMSTRNVIQDTTPTISWTSPPGATKFQVFIRDETLTQGRMYTVENETEVREFTVPDDEALQFGGYTAWVRTVYPNPSDLNRPETRLSPWSTPFKFEVGPRVEVIGPVGSSFAETPTLRWKAVPRATEYEVFVISKADHQAGGKPPLVRQTVTGTSLELSSAITGKTDFPDGPHLFWVRAVNRTTGKPTVYGSWGGPTEFSTPVQAPTVTVPSAIARTGQNDLVTAANPKIEITPIDGAARYEIWINRSNSRKPYLRETSTTSSPKLENALPEGTYFLWARAISTTGEFSPWSDVVIFDTTGGRPVVTSPTDGQTVDGFSTTVTWTPVEDAASYNLWIDYRGVDFTFIVESGIEDNSYTIDAPLAPGEYRVWVQAVFADGSKSFWSRPIVFEVGVVDATDSQPESPSASGLIVAVQLPEITTEPTPAADLPDETYRHQEADVTVAEAAGQESRQTVTAPVLGVSESIGSDDGSATAPLPEDLLAKLATECVRGEWWDLSSFDA